MLCSVVDIYGDSDDLVLEVADLLITQSALITPIFCGELNLLNHYQNYTRTGTHLPYTRLVITFSLWVYKYSSYSTHLIDDMLLLAILHWQGSVDVRCVCSVCLRQRARRGTIFSSLSLRNLRLRHTLHTPDNPCYHCRLDQCKHYLKLLFT